MLSRSHGLMFLRPHALMVLVALVALAAPVALVAYVAHVALLALMAVAALMALVASCRAFRPRAKPGLTRLPLPPVHAQTLLSIYDSDRNVANPLSFVTSSS